MATGGESQETRPQSTQSLVQAALARTNEALNMTAEAREQGGVQEAWQQEVERAATRVAEAAARVEAANRESMAAVAELKAAVMTLDAAKQTARQISPRAPPPIPASTVRALPLIPASTSKTPPPIPASTVRALPLVPVSTSKTPPPIPASTVRAPPPTPAATSRASPLSPLPPSVCTRHQCSNTVTDSESGSRCTSGHALCAPCTAQYVKAMHPSQGTVRWDTIDCVDQQCTAYMGGVSVQSCISHGLMASIAAAQLAAVPTSGPEARRERDRAAEAAASTFLGLDRASEAATAESELFKPCPKCKVLTEKAGGPDYINCGMCQHEYYWSCQCVYPTARHVACVPR